MRIALIANTQTSLPSIVNFNDGSAPQFCKIKKKAALPFSHRFSSRFLLLIVELRAQAAVLYTESSASPLV